ncbi:MAG: methionyl-tRNA formyltransferase [Pyrinomonadaceae bacterium]
MPDLRIVLAGSVGSSRRTLMGLLRHKASVVGVLGLSVERAAGVSGYCRLDDIAQEAGCDYREFVQLNDPEIVSVVEAWSPDLFFVVGLSQLVKSPLLSAARLGCVGFHPTMLPAGRGRAPVSWLTLDGDGVGAATFFLLNEEADAGAILAQEPFAITSKDYAGDVMGKLEEAIDRALDRWLPKLLAGEWNPQYQDERLATYNGRRAPEDGLIDWNSSACRIESLVRASAHPHPGAYTYVKDNRMIVWRAEIETDMSFRGVTGRILLIDAGGRALVQTGNGLLWLSEVEFVADSPHAPKPALRVGMKLGYTSEDEIYALKARITALEEHLSQNLAGRSS